MDLFALKARFGFGLHEGALRPAAFHEISQQTGDQQGLEKEDGNPAYDPGAVALPNRWLAEQDRASGRKAIRADLPSLELTPVITRRSLLQDEWRNAGGWLP